MRIRHLLLASAASCAWSLAGAPAMANTDDQPVVEEIVITAQRRSERLQDVPVSVAAVSGDALADQRVTQIDDLASKIPNLQLTSTSGANTPIFALRGVSMSDYSLNQAGPVATYFDEVYKGNFALLGVSMYDLERVEVLRGPQGTLYGKNTTGGAANLISRSPTFASEGYLNVGYGTFNRYDATGALNMPLTDTVALRVAFTRSLADGWMRNRLPGHEDASGTDEYGVRVSLRYAPNPDLDVTLRLATSLQRPTNDGIYAEPGPLGVGAGVYQMFKKPGYFRAGLDTYDIESNFDARRHARTTSAALTTHLALSEDLSLTSVTSYDHGFIAIPEDTDGSPLATLELPSGGSANQISQDLRLAFKNDGPLDVLVGVYGQAERVFNRNELGIFKDIDVTGDGKITAADCAAGFPVACRVQNRFHQTKQSLAAYVDAAYELNPSLTLRGGLRVTHDNGTLRDLRSEARGVDGALVAVLINEPAGRSFRTTNLSGKVGVDFRTPHGDLLYLSYNRGYRGQAFNAQALFDRSELNVARPETVDAVEIGLKSQWLDRRLTLNGSLFYYGYRDQQFLDVDPTNSTQRLVNLDRSIIYGGELELSAAITARLKVNAGLGLLSAKIEDGLLRGQDLSGKHLPNAPAATFNADATFVAFDDDRGQLELGVNVSYAGSQYFEVFNVSRLQQDAYAQLGAQATWSSKSGGRHISVWGRNLTNETYFTSRIDLRDVWGFDYNHLGAPRTFGVTLGLSY